MPTHNKNSEADFWARIDMSEGPNACWPCAGARSPRGYIRFRYNGKYWRANRLAWFLTTGELPEAVCHKCDNPACCNPNHLWGGTYKQNNQDRANKGRSADLKGSDRHNAKFKPTEILAIRRLKALGVGAAKLSGLYNTSTSYINQIIKLRVWSHITG